LKDRLRDVGTVNIDGAEQKTTGDQLRDDLLSALENLGYHRPLAEKAVDAVRARDDAAGFEAALKGALRELMR